MSANDGDEFEIAEGITVDCAFFIVLINGLQGCVLSGPSLTRGQTDGTRRYSSLQKKCDVL